MWWISFWWFCFPHIASVGQLPIGRPKPCKGKKTSNHTSPKIATSPDAGSSPSAFAISDQTFAHDVRNIVKTKQTFEQDVRNIFFCCSPLGVGSGQGESCPLIYLTVANSYDLFVGPCMKITSYLVGLSFAAPQKRYNPLRVHTQNLHG